MKKIIGIFVVCAIAMQIIVSVIFNSDENAVEIESWLAQQEKVTSVVGSNINFRIKKRVNVNSTPEQPGYSIYTFIINGADGDAMAIVEATGKNEYRIKSFKVK